MDVLELVIRALALVAPAIAVSVYVGSTAGLVLGIAVGVFLNVLGEAWLTPAARRLRADLETKGRTIARLEEPETKVEQMERIRRDEARRRSYRRAFRTPED